MQNIKNNSFCTIEVFGDQENYQHSPQNGTLLIIANVSTFDVTFCKVVAPFAQDALHITIPPDPQSPDKLR